MLAVLLAGCAAKQVGSLVAQGDRHDLRSRGRDAAASSPARPPILFLALDGVGRDLLYAELRAGKLPGFARLLGGAGGGFAHAHFNDHLLSTLPSTTMAAWMTAVTGVAPAEHGVAGNEYFIREETKLACPAPVSFASAEPTLEIYTDDYLDKLGAARTAYERMRDTDPTLLIWVAMHGIYRGADTLLLAKRTAMARAFEGLVEDQARQRLDDTASRKLYENLDAAVVKTVVAGLETGTLPDVLTVYLSGTDLYAHVAAEGPDRARITYLEQVVDPLLIKLANALDARHALAGRWIVVTSDHGHTQVIDDDAHALSTKPGEDPPSVLEVAGFRLRPFAREVGATAPFNAVLAYGGAMAYVYLANRALCPGATDVCDWKQPPRYEADVLAAADAFYKNDADGAVTPAMKGALDMILVRRPRPYAEVDLPFEVYVGDGKTMQIDAWLREHPHPTYVYVEERLRDLAVGRYGERAGDVLLLAHNGDRARPEDRFYFAAPYRSWHGSPSRQDSEIPLIVASSTHTAAEIGAYVGTLLGDRPFQQRVADLLLGLRAGALGK
ncbi:MAG: alkaline phosphatase family protein [Proteobacteria bacterium]|nr:alkaline phosphatase family protein [Pseudomonadota bacterium]